MSRRTVKVLLVLFLAVMVSGCWDQREIEDLGIVQAIGIDKQAESKTGVRLIVQVINPKAVGAGGGGGGGGGVAGGGTKGGGVAPFRNFSAGSDLLFTAFRELSKISPRRLFFAHTQVIIISEELARERKITDVMDFLDRNPQIRRQVWVLVARSDLNEFFNQAAPLESTLGMRISGIIRDKSLNSQYGISRLGEFIKDLQAEGTEPYTAGVGLIPSMAVPQGSPPAGELKVEVAVSDTAVFKKGRLAGWLDPTESRGLLWVRNRVEGGAIPLSCPGHENSKIALEILSSNTRVTPELQNGAVRIRIEVEEESNIDEATCPLELNKPATLRQLEQLQNEYIFREIEAALEKTQKELGADVFGFGNAVFHAYPQYWREIRDQWDEIFPNLEVDVAVHSRIRRTGLVTRPAVIK